MQLAEHSSAVPLEGESRQILDAMVAFSQEIAEGPLETIHERSVRPDVEKALRLGLADLSFDLLRALAPEGAYLQGVPNLRAHRPGDPNSVVPFHSDVLYGHSPDEINFWVNLTPVGGTNSLWLSERTETEILHEKLRQSRLSLEEFERLAIIGATPIEDDGPGVHTFCCAQVHGTKLNQTGTTRVSMDLRFLPRQGRENVKKRGGYFLPAWLEATACPLEKGTPITTVASLDEAAPVYLQRVVMEQFYPQGKHLELVEFFGLPNHAPHLERAMQEGPVLAYTVRQLREVPEITHPIGFADERLWITPQNVDVLKRLIDELRDAPRL
jgi:hypothetical protein